MVYIGGIPHLQTIDPNFLGHPSTTIGSGEDREHSFHMREKLLLEREVALQAEKKLHQVNLGGVFKDLFI